MSIRSRFTGTSTQIGIILCSVLQWWRQILLVAAGKCRTICQKMNVSTRLQKTSRRKLLIQSGEADAWSYGIIFQKGTIFLVDGGFTLLLCMLVPITQFLALQTSGLTVVWEVVIPHQGVICKIARYKSCSYHWALKTWCSSDTLSGAKFVHV